MNSDDDTVILATINDYSERMTNANTRFIRDRIADINGRGYTTELRKLDVMARFWFHDKHWPRPGEFQWEQAPADRRRQALLEEAVTTLEEVRNLPHLHMNGLVASTLATQAAVDIVADTMEEVARENAEAEGPQANISFRIPDDVRCFLKHANGIQDPDFRYEGMCSWDIVSPGIKADENTDLTSLANDVRDSLTYLSVDPESYKFTNVRDYLDIKAGFYCGEASKHERDMWSSYYLFSRECDDEDNDGLENQGWAWRMVFDCASDALEYIDMELPVFTSVAGLLAWYGGWDRTLDVEEMKHNMFDPGMVSQRFGDDEDLDFDDDDEDE